MNDSAEQPDDRTDNSRENLARRVSSMRAAGMSIREIAAALNISRSRAHRLAVNDGRRLERERKATAKYAQAALLARLERAHSVAWRLVNDTGLSAKERLLAVEKIVKVAAQQAKLHGLDKTHVVVKSEDPPPAPAPKISDEQRAAALCKMLGITTDG